MNKIILIDSKWQIDSPAVQHALKTAKTSDAEIAAVFLVDDSSGAVEKAEATIQKVKQKFSSEGVGFSSSIVSQSPEQFMKLIDELMPASLVLLGDVSFSDEMVKGGASKEALKEKLACPVVTAGEMSAAQADTKPAQGINWGKFIIYAICSALMYGVLFPRIESLNEFFMSKTVLGAVAVLTVVVVHAWVWGNTTQILPKLLKLEK